MVSSSPAPTLVDPSHMSVLAKVEGEKAVVQPETTPAGKKKKRSDSPKPSPRSSKKKPSTSSRPSSEDLKNLDDKWAERFARLEAMLLAKSFTVPVELVVKPAAEVTTSQKPFFDPGASTSSLARSTGNSGSSLVQATGDAVDEMQTATQPLEASGARTATQPVQAPGSVPDVLPSGTGDVDFNADQTLTGSRVVQSSSGSESEDDQHSVTGSLLEGNYWDGSPDRELTRDESADQELSEEANYRETIRGVRSFMGWHKVPEFESVLLLMTTFLPVHVSSQPVKCQSSFRWMIGCVRRWTSLISPSQRDTLQEILTLLASSRISSSSLPSHPDGMGCILIRTVRVTLYAPGLRNRPSSTIHLAKLPDIVFLLPHPPGPSVRTCLGVAREQPMNKLSCATRLLDYQDP